MSAMKGLSSVWNRVVSRDRWAARPFHARAGTRRATSVTRQVT